MTIAPTFVYFLATQDRAMVKIGCSEQPEQRLETFRMWSPVALDIIASVQGSILDERALHARYLAQHSHKEWFRSTPEMLADIATIARLGELPSELRGKPGQKNMLPNTIQSPEHRAKVSLIQKARYAREKLKLAFTPIPGEAA